MLQFNQSQFAVVTNLFTQVDALVGSVDLGICSSMRGGQRGKRQRPAYAKRPAPQASARARHTSASWCHGLAGHHASHPCGLAGGASQVWSSVSSSIWAALVLAGRA